MIPRDKLLHAAAGVVCFVVGALLVAPWAGLALAVVAGIGREVWQRRTGRGTVDPWDAVATIAPAVVLWIAAAAVVQYGGVRGPEVTQRQDAPELRA